MIQARKGGIFPARRFSLPVYISLLLITVALLTLLATISSIEIFLQPSLINQISSDMEKDAQTHVQLIDTYFSERLNDVKVLSSSQPLEGLLSGDRNDTDAASNLLFTAFHRDVADYISISVLNTQQQVVLDYPAPPQLHGQYLVQPEALTQLQNSAQVISSDVFYDPLANTPSIDLYARIVNNNFQPLGILRASISLHRLWEPVDSEVQVNGPGSYSFVLDQHGVRIAYTNPDHSGFTRPSYLFKAVAPLSPGFLQTIKNENLYGNVANQVTTVEDGTLASMQTHPQQSAIFQFTPAGQGQTFEAASYASAVFPWTYFVLKPLSSITGLANQQLLTVILIVFFVILFAVVIGIQAGRRITVPIMRSVLSLHDSSTALKTLADQEQTVATEQSWIVEASQTALKSIRYYTRASHQATQRLSFLGQSLKEGADRMDRKNLLRLLEEVQQTTEYIDQALKYQESANERLASSIRVATQANEQLTNDAKSTDETAARLEEIVFQLMKVVGNRTDTPEES